MLKYNIVYRGYGDRKNAEKHLNYVKGIAENPIIKQSKTTFAWFIILCQCNDKPKAEEAYRYFKSKGLHIFIQTVIQND